MRHHDASGDEERGSVTLWVLGLAVGTLLLGGLAIDVGRAFTVRQELAAIADAAAIAGASGLDVGALREGGVALDDDRVDLLATEAVASHSGATLVDDLVVSTVGRRQVLITVRGRASLGLLGALLDAPAFDIEVHASAEPRRVP